MAFVLKSEFDELLDKPIEEYFAAFQRVWEKRKPTSSRLQRELGPAENWKYRIGVTLEPKDPRWKQIMGIYKIGNSENLQNVFFAGPPFSLSKIEEMLGEYEVGIKEADKSAAFIFLLKGEHNTIGAFEFNLRGKKFEKEGDTLFELGEDGSKSPANPDEIEFTNFTIHFRDKRLDQLDK